VTNSLKSTLFTFPYFGSHLPETARASMFAGPKKGQY